MFYFGHNPCQVIIALKTTFFREIRNNIRVQRGASRRRNISLTDKAKIV